MDVLHARRLKAEFNAQQSGGWSQSDHDLWKALMKAGGFEQPPLDGSINERSD